MPGGNPIYTDDPSPQGHGKRKAWQGGATFALGLSWSAATWFGYGFVWWGTIALTLVGFFWMLTGLITMFTGYE
jgi:hypothetical protein